MAFDLMATTLPEIAADVRNAIVGGPFGSNLISRDYVELGVPVIRGQNMGMGKYVGGEYAYVSEEKAQSLSANIARPNDLVFTQRGTLGQVAIVPENKWDRYVVSQSQMKATIDATKADIEFLYYYFSSPREINYILSNAIQTGVPHTNLTQLKEHPIQLPTLADQKAIAQILGTLDDKIELNRQMNATLEAMAQALFKSWFVDFDPVIDNALAAGNPIPDALRKKGEVRRVKGENGNEHSPITPHHSLFPNRFVFNDNLGWVPEGWEVSAVEDAIQVNPKVTLKKGEVAPFVDMKALPISGFDINEVMYKAYGGGAKFQQGDVLLARITPCLENGKTGLVEFLEGAEVGFGSTEFIVMRGKGLLKAPYVACLARYPAFRSHCELGMVGSSGRQRVQNSSFSDYFLALPPENGVLEEFDRMTSPSFDKMSISKDESKNLAKIRDTLLPKLLSGQLRIPEAEKQVAEVL